MHSSRMRTVRPLAFWDTTPPPPLLAPLHSGIHSTPACPIALWDTHHPLACPIVFWDTPPPDCPIACFYTHHPAWTELQTHVKTLPCLKLRLRPVKTNKIKFRFRYESNPYMLMMSWRSQGRTNDCISSLSPANEVAGK